MSNRPWIWPTAAVIVAVVILGFMLLAINKLPRNPETQIGLVIVLAVVVLSVLLTFMGTVFRSLGIFDVSKPLGLPEGTIRALITIYLLVMFVIVGIFLFMRVSGAVFYRFDVDVPKEDVREFVTQFKDRIVGTMDSRDGKNVRITIRQPADVTDEGKQMAQQMLTIMSTLLGTIGGFYYGTSALRAARGEPVALKVARISPRSAAPQPGPPQPDVDIDVMGVGFSEGAYVLLRSKIGTQPDIDATAVKFVSPSLLKCSFNLAGRGAGKWDVVVTNPDGREASKPDAFSIV